MSEEWKRTSASKKDIRADRRQGDKKDEEDKKTRRARWEGRRQHKKKTT